MANNLMMHDPELLEVLVDIYFNMKKEEEEPPTVPGLVLAMGFNRVHEVTQVLAEYDEAGEKYKRYPERSINIIFQSLTRIEEYNVENGLRDRIPPAMAKFLLGAYHGVKEPSANQQNGTVNFLNIAFEAPPHQVSMRDTATAALSIQKNPKMLQHTQSQTVIEVQTNG